MTRIAILIPTYNGAPYIATALQSVIEATPQKYGIEAVYISDDSSTDNTIEVARDAWTDATPLIMLQSGANQGLYGNHNHGLRALSDMGIEWVLILHQDDYVHSNWISVMVEHIQKCVPTIISICSSYDSFFEDDRITLGENRINDDATIIHGTPGAIQDTIRRGCWWHISGCAIRMSAFEELGLFDAGLPHWADWDWIMRSMTARKDILYIPQSLMGWRQHDSSYSATSIRSVFYTQQQIVVVGRFRKFLSQGDLLRWHLKEGSYALHRLGRALLIRHWQYAQASTQTMGLLFQSAFRSVSAN